MGILYLYKNRKEENFSETIKNLFNEIEAFDFTVVLYIRAFGLLSMERNDTIQYLFEKPEELEREKINLITYGNEAEKTNLDMCYNALKARVITH